MERHRTDAVLVAEHHLSSRHKFELRGYVSYRQPRVGGKGGETAFFLKEGIRSEQLTVDLGNIEATVVRVKGIEGRNILIMSLYHRPNSTLCETDLDVLMDVIGDESVITGADLNAKSRMWGGDLINACGRVLQTWIVINPTLSMRPTREPTRINRVTDS